MTNTTYFETYRDEISESSSSEESHELDNTGEEDNHASSSTSLYSVVGRKIRRWIHGRGPYSKELRGIVTTKFSYSQLRRATGNFIPENMIGQGGTATVYKGTLPNKREIAVKKFMEIAHWEQKAFIAEVLILSAVQHHNIVEMCGFCAEQKNKLIVYEYFQNRSLDQPLFGKSNLHLDWTARYNICLGTATGLAYLHEEAKPRVIHRDVKPHNILLDIDLNPKLCDFGLSKQYDATVTHLSTTIGGTMGYFAPEVITRGLLTEKADVYSFGIVALEILAGRNNIDAEAETKLIYLLGYAWTLYEDNHMVKVVDPRLTSFNQEEVSRILQVALMCTETSPLARPPMSQVVAILRGDVEPTPMMKKPAFLTDVQLDDSSTIYMNEDRISGSPQPTPHGVDEFSGVNNMLATFSYAELKTATGDFNLANKLGQGGFGPVYKGKLADEREIAVKKLLVISPHGESQFMAEISTISAVQHPNLVKLYGCCIEEEKRLLVYEHLINKSLDKALFGKSDIHLDWTTRYNICLGSARGLAYFHEESNPRIIHRDVKASNILMDIDMNPKISDLGLARLYDDTKAHVTTKVGGTIGYVAPEYAMRGILTEKVDVFGFGVVVLEIISGRPIIDSRLDSERSYLLEFVWTLLENHRSLELVDPRLTDFNKEEVIRLLGVALLCIQASAKLRPAMSRVVAMLTGDEEVRPTVTEKPSYLMNC